MVKRALAGFFFFSIALYVDAQAPPGPRPGDKQVVDAAAADRGKSAVHRCVHHVSRSEGQRHRKRTGPVSRVNSPRVKILYDIYHAQIMDGDIVRNIRDQFQWIGHVHTGGNPGRHESMIPRN